MAYLGQRTFASFEKKARGWGDFFEEDGENEHLILFRNENEDSNSEAILNLKRGINIYTSFHNLLNNKNGWELLLEEYHRFSNSSKELIKIYLEDPSFEKQYALFVKYLRKNIYSEDTDFSLNAKDLLFYLKQEYILNDIEYEKNLLIVELEVIKLSVPNDFLISQEISNIEWRVESFQTDIDNFIITLDNLYESGLLTFHGIENIRKRIQHFIHRKNSVNIILQNLHQLWNNTSEDIHNQGLRQEIISLYQFYVGVIFNYFSLWFVSFDFSSKTFEFKDKHPDFESSDGYSEMYQYQIANGLMIDLYLELIRADKSISNLLEALDNVDNEDLNKYVGEIKTDAAYISVVISLLGGKYENKTKKGALTNLAKENPQAFIEKQIEISERLGNILLNIQNISMILSAYVMDDTYDESWQIIDVFDDENLDMAARISLFLKDSLELLEEYHDQPEILSKKLNELADYWNLEKAVEQYKEFYKEEEDLREILLLIAEVALTIASIWVGGVLGRIAGAGIRSLSALSTSTNILLRSVGSISSGIASRSLAMGGITMAIESAGFVAAHKLLNSLLTGKLTWDDFLKEWGKAFVLFAVLRGVDKAYSLLRPATLEAQFVLGSTKFTTEVLALEGIEWTAHSLENYILDEEKEREFFTWESLSYSALFLVLVKTGMLASQKISPGFVWKIEKSALNKIELKTSELELKLDEIKGKEETPENFKLLTTKTIELLKIQKSAYEQVYNSKTQTDKKEQEHLHKIINGIDLRIQDLQKASELYEMRVEESGSGEAFYFEGSSEKLKNILTKNIKEPFIFEKVKGVEQELYYFKVGNGKAQYFIRKNRTKTIEKPHETAELLGYEFKDVQRDFWQQLVDNHGQPDFSKIGSAKTNIAIQQALNEGWRPGKPIPENIIKKLYNEIGLFNVRFVETNPELLNSKENLEAEIKDAKGAMKALEIGLQLPPIKSSFESFKKGSNKSKNQWKAEQLNQLNKLSLSEYARELFELNKLRPTQNNLSKLLEINLTVTADRLQMHRILEHSQKQPYTNAEKTLNLIHKLATECKSVNGVPTVIGDLTKGGNFYKGAHWMLRYIDAKNMWEKVGAFEVRTDTEGTNEVRRYDMKTTDGTLYQFKTWTSWNEAGVIKQLKQDIANTKGGLQGIKDSNLKWVFEETSLGDYGVIKAKFIKAIEKLPKEITQREKDIIIENVDKIIVVGLK